VLQALGEASGCCSVDWVLTKNFYDVLYLGTNFEPLNALYFRTEGVYYYFYYTHRKLAPRNQLVWKLVERMGTKGIGVEKFPL
jgi:hypothetical protein